MKKASAPEAETPPEFVLENRLGFQDKRIEELSATLEQVIIEVERQRQQLVDVIELAGGNMKLATDLKQLIEELAQAQANQTKASVAAGKHSVPWLKR